MRMDILYAEENVKTMASQAFVGEKIWKNGNFYFHFFTE